MFSTCSAQDTLHLQLGLCATQDPQRQDTRVDEHLRQDSLLHTGYLYCLRCSSVSNIAFICCCRRKSILQRYIKSRAAQGSIQRDQGWCGALLEQHLLNCLWLLVPVHQQARPTFRQAVAPDAAYQLGLGGYELSQWEYHPSVFNT